MTVLTYDVVTGTAACDSRTTQGERKGYMKKFKELANGKVVMFAGDVREGRAAIRHIERNTAMPVDLLKETTVVVFDKKTGTALVYDETHIPERVNESDAWGSGSDFAIGALDAGATAEEAAKIACRRSTSCGGQVHVFKE